MTEDNTKFYKYWLYKNKNYDNNENNFEKI